jgi:hypothetical protein
MPINTETLNRQLYKRLSKYKPKPLDATGNVTPIEDEADVFKFTFSKDGEDYGTVFATVDDNHALTIYYSDDVTESPAGPSADLDYDDSWTGLLKQLKSWAMHNQLSWNLKDRSRLEGDMARRDHMNKKDKISEGYHAMGKSRSYSDNIPSVKIVIEHSRQIEEGEQRYRNINKIFLENQMGERFLLDTKKPGIARVYARHIAEGGKVNDERWGHIQGLCEEYQKMAGFVRATRNGQFNESAQKLVNEAINHYQSLRESLSRMTGKRGYEAYFESWTPPLMEDETDTSNLNELFVQETLDPRIESVMPILSKLQKNLGEMKEVDALAEWADSLIEGEGGSEASEEEDILTPGDAGEGGAEDAPEDDLTEDESIKSNNPVGIPEEVEEGFVGNMINKAKGMFTKPGQPAAAPAPAAPVVPDAATQARIAAAPQGYDPNTGKPQVAAKAAPGAMQKGGTMDMTKKVVAPVAKPAATNPAGNYDPNTGQPISAKGKADAASQAAFNASPQGKAMDAYFKDQQAGKFKGTFKQWQQQQAQQPAVAEDLDANQKRVGQLGPTEKVKNNNIGKLVGANESAFTTHKGGKVTSKDGVTKHQSGPGTYGGYDDSIHPDSPEEKHANRPGATTGHRTDKIKKHKDVEENFIGMAPQAVAEGQDDLNALLRLLGK